MYNNFLVWEPQVTITGHFGPVEQVKWDPTSNYIISVRYKNNSI